MEGNEIDWDDIGPVAVGSDDGNSDEEIAGVIMPAQLAQLHGEQQIVPHRPPADIKRLTPSKWKISLPHPSKKKSVRARPWGITDVGWEGFHTVTTEKKRDEGYQRRYQSFAITWCSQGWQGDETCQPKWKV